MMASMCVRILFLLFEKLVIRQSHNIKETLREKKNIDLYLVNKSKITEQLHHIYCHGIISLKEFLIVCRQKFRQQIRKLERFTEGKFCRCFLNWSWHLQTPNLTLVQQPSKTTQEPSCAMAGDSECSVLSYIQQSSRKGRKKEGKRGMGPFSQR